MKHPNRKRIIWILFGIPAILSAQSPGGVSTNLSLWVKADAGLTVTGSTVNKWTDQTGINTFTRSGSGITTVANTVNFHPVVRFTGNGTLQGYRLDQLVGMYGRSRMVGLHQLREGHGDLSHHQRHRSPTTPRDISSGRA